MLKNKVNRQGEFTAIPKYIRKQVSRNRCQICGSKYNLVSTVGGKIRHPKQHIEHLIPRRWLSEHGIYEHHVYNLLSVCNFCHAPKARLEDRLYQGDVLSYMQGLNRLHFPINKLLIFAASIGIKEFQGIAL